MHQLEMIDGDVRVNPRALQRGMTEHRLDVTDVAARFEQLRGHRVPEQVATAPARDAGAAKDVTHLRTKQQD